MWAVTMTGKNTHSFSALRRSKYFLKKRDERRCGVWVRNTNDFTRFNTKSEARKALNARVMYAIKNWGLDYVVDWIYGVEEITD